MAETVDGTQSWLQVLSATLLPNKSIIFLSFSALSQYAHGLPSVHSFVFCVIIIHHVFFGEVENSTGLTKLHTVQQR